jgi:hypothetical protein
MKPSLLCLCLILSPLVSCGQNPAKSSAQSGAFAKRADWGTVAPDTDVLKRQPMGKVRYISVHHTETPIPDSVSEVQRLRNIQSYHQQTQQWGDIAYHYLIGPSGKVYEGRAEAYASSSGTVYLTQAQWEAAPQDETGRTTAAKPEGIAKPGHSAGHLTICFVGSYGGQLPTPAARDAASALIVRKLKEHGLGAEALFFHREIACWSDCPGQALYDWFRGPSRKRGAQGEGLRSIVEALKQ